MPASSLPQTSFFHGINASLVANSVTDFTVRFISECVMLLHLLSSCSPHKGTDHGSKSLISLFRSRSGAESQRDGEKQTLIDRCDVIVEDGEGVRSRFTARIVFRNGLTSTHRLPFEVVVPVHAKFSRQESPHHWSISSRTLRQLMDHFGPGIEYLDINTNGDHVNFTCFSEKTVSGDGRHSYHDFFRFMY